MKRPCVGLAQRSPTCQRKGRPVSNDDIAAAVLECVGGFPNVIGNSLCATRLRISIVDTNAVNRNALRSIKGVLGVVDRGSNGIEVVFGPNLVRGVYTAFEHLTGIFSGRHSTDVAEPTRPSSNFQVKITPEIPGMAQTTPAADTDDHVADDDTSLLLELLGDEV